MAPEVSLWFMLACNEYSGGRHRSFRHPADRIPFGPVIRIYRAFFYCRRATAVKCFSCEKCKLFLSLGKLFARLHLSLQAGLFLSRFICNQAALTVTYICHFCWVFQHCLSLVFFKLVFRFFLLKSYCYWNRQQTEDAQYTATALKTDITPTSHWQMQIQAI